MTITLADYLLYAFVQIQLQTSFQKTNGKQEVAAYTDEERLENDELFIPLRPLVLTRHDSTCRSLSQHIPAAGHAAGSPQPRRCHHNDEVR